MVDVTSDTFKEWSRLGHGLSVPLPRPSFLDEQDYLGFIEGERRWRSPDKKRLFTYDDLHGEIEVFNRRGRHLGAVDVMTGTFVKGPRKGRSISV